MSRLVVVLCVLSGCIILWPSHAGAATTFTGPAAKPWMKSCAARSKVPTPNVALNVVTSSSPPAEAWASPWGLTIGFSSYALRGGAFGCANLLHELGHVFDWTMLTQDDRRFASCYILREPTPNPWWGYWDGMKWVYGGSINGPQERFAEAYALVALYSTLRGGRNWIDYVSQGVSYGLEQYFDPVRHAKFKRFVRAASAGRTPDASQRDQLTAIAPC